MDLSGRVVLITGGKRMGLAVAVVTQGRTLDETVSNLREAIALHLRDDEWRRLDIAPPPRLVISYEPSLVEA